MLEEQIRFLAPGIEFEIIDGEVMNAYIDLSNEYVLRDDMVDTGNIKKEKKRKVYPRYLAEFCRGYQIYMHYLEGKKYEEKYGPLTINRDGKAMTYDSFYYHFKKVIKEVIPIMLSSDDREIVSYGLMIQQYGIAPHIFRHYFSLRMADEGASLAELMQFRGDSTKDASLVYLQNKSMLTKEVEFVSNQAFAFNLWRASKIYDQFK